MIISEGFLQSSSTPLISASLKGHTKIVKLLLENGADINMKTTKGTSALWIASLEGRTEVVKLLLENDADINMKTADGFTALMAASQGNHAEVVKLLLELQNRRPEGYPYVLVPPGRYDRIQQVLRPKGKWTLPSTRNCVIHNFTTQFDKILAIAHVKKGTFHDIRRTAITNWFRQGLSEHDVMTLAGHANFATTHEFYLAVADDLITRARQATAHQVSQELLQKCCQNNQRGAL